MWKELLNRAGWLLIFFLATILYQFLGGYCYFNFKCSTTVTVRADSCWYFDCSFGTIYFGARKTQLASFNFFFFRAKDLARLGLSYLVIICSNILGSIFVTVKMRRQQVISLRLMIWFKIVL